MKLSQLGELALIETVRASFAVRAQGVRTGIGDDAAVLRPGAGDLLATSDAMLESVHFDPRLVTPFQLGRKLIAVNVSDIYAMGGRPRFALVTVAVPPATRDEFMAEFFRGVREALEKAGAALVGGDVSGSRHGTALSATLIGTAGRPILRSGGRPGEGIYVSGPLGDAACGLALLRAIGRPVSFARPVKGPLPWKVMRPLLLRHLMPEPRSPRPYLRSARAMIDVSDGLFLDLWRLCSESGVGARIYEDRLPISPDLTRAAAHLGLRAFDLATKGGEDYELLFTAPRRSCVRAVRIGETTGEGMVVVRSDGREAPIRPEGYRHFG
jgi:thiamine-monophosphate kinase